MEVRTLNESERPTPSAKPSWGGDTSPHSPHLHPDWGRIKPEPGTPPRKAKTLGSKPASKGQVAKFLTDLAEDAPNVQPWEAEVREIEWETTALRIAYCRCVLLCLAKKARNMPSPRSTSRPCKDVPGWVKIEPKFTP